MRKDWSAQFVVRWPQRGSEPFKSQHVKFFRVLVVRVRHVDVPGCRVEVVELCFHSKIDKRSVIGPEPSIRLEPCLHSTYFLELKTYCILVCLTLYPLAQ